MGELVQIDGSLGLKVGRRAVVCWSLLMTPLAASWQHASWRRRSTAYMDLVGEHIRRHDLLQDFYTTVDCGTGGSNG